jgi:hypothetical protein
MPNEAPLGGPFSQSAVGEGKMPPDLMASRKARLSPVIHLFTLRRSLAGAEGSLSATFNSYAVSFATQQS